VLLKSEQRTSTEVANILGCCEVVVNSWLKRFEAEGIEGLKTRPGRGRKSILNADEDLEQVKQAVQASRSGLAWPKWNYSWLQNERRYKKLGHGVLAGLTREGCSSG
jgi:transposase